MEADRKCIGVIWKNGACQWNWACSKRATRHLLPNSSLRRVRPDNRLIAAQRERAGKQRSERVETVRGNVKPGPEQQPNRTIPTPDFAGIATDLETAWRAQCRYALRRRSFSCTLVSDIIADVDEEKRRIL